MTARRRFQHADVDATARRGRHRAARDPTDERGGGSRRRRLTLAENGAYQSNDGISGLSATAAGQFDGHAAARVSNGFVMAVAGGRSTIAGLAAVVRVPRGTRGGKPYKRPSERPTDRQEGGTSAYRQRGTTIIIVGCRGSK